MDSGLDDIIREGQELIERLPEEDANSILETIKQPTTALAGAIHDQVLQKDEDSPDKIVDDFIKEEADSKKRELEQRIQQQAEELEELRQKLAAIPVVKVIETVGEYGEQKNVKYEYGRLSIEDEEAKNLQAMAERARLQAEAAEKSAEKARREAAEEVFRFEAAKAEVRLEAFRIQQRLLKERKDREARQTPAPSPPAKKDLTVRDGWVKIKRSGPVGAWDRRFLTVRAQGLSLYLDDAGGGQCVNAVGHEQIQRVGRVGSGPMMEVHHHAGVLLLDCGELSERERWVQAIEQTLARFRTTYVAQPPQKRRAIEEVHKSAFDAAAEERTRRELQRQRQTVLDAERRRDAAERELDRARALHIETDKELRLRIKFPDISSEFVGTMPPTQARKNEIGFNPASMVDVAELEKAVGAAKESAKKEAQKALAETTQAFQSKVSTLEKAKTEAEQELQMYKEMAYKDAERRAKAEAYNNLSARERANAEAQAFDARMYKDGMLVVPDGWGFEDVPGLSNLPSPRQKGAVKRDNVTVFVDGPQAVVIQGVNVAAYSTDDKTEDTERAAKVGPAKAEAAVH